MQLPVLVMSNFQLPFVIETDASGAGIGEVISQGTRPIAYISKRFSEKGKLKSVYERELLAIVFDVKKWRHYLRGNKFVIRTDQKSLKYLLDHTSVSVEQHQWASKLLGLNYSIEYKSSTENRVADALSRLPHTEQFMELELIALISLDRDELVN